MTTTSPVSLRDLLEQDLTELLELRRHLHAHPELSGEEHQTAAELPLLAGRAEGSHAVVADDVETAAYRRDGGGTHFTVTIKAASFAGKSRVQQHRLVNSILADELAGDIHALELHLFS